MERNICTVINNIMVVSKKYNKNTPEVIGELRNVISSLKYMPYENIQAKQHWVRLINVLQTLFPITEENQNDEFIQLLKSILMNENTDTFEPYTATDAEESAINQYIDFRHYIKNII